MRIPRARRRSAISGRTGNDAVGTAGGAASPRQMPALHWSLTVPALESSHTSPSLAGVAEQESATSLQLPVLHWSPLAEQSVAPPPLQTPDEQVSPALQKSPSLQAPPSLAGAPPSWGSPRDLT